MEIKKGDPRLKNFTDKKELIVDLMNRFNIDPKDMTFYESEEDWEQKNRKENGHNFCKQN